MNKRASIRFLIGLGICLLTYVTVLSPNAVAQSAKPASEASSADFQAPSNQEIDLMKKDLRSQKKQIIAATIKLTDTEAEKFWPVYDQYVAELAKTDA
jgi:hypothetical protein